MAPTLVTGGLGFFGSFVVDRLAERRRVRCLDSLDAMAHDATPSYANPDAEHLPVDLRDPEAVLQVVQGVTAVCHQAAMVGLGVVIGVTSGRRHVAGSRIGNAFRLET